MADGYFRRDEEHIARAEARHECAEPGPWGTVCTDDPGHRYSHYDAIDDSSWQDGWREDGPEDDESTDSESQTIGKPSQTTDSESQDIGKPSQATDD